MKLTLAFVILSIIFTKVFACIDIKITTNNKGGGSLELRDSSATMCTASWKNIDIDKDMNTDFDCENGYKGKVKYNHKNEKYTVDFSGRSNDDDLSDKEIAKEKNNQKGSNDITSYRLNKCPYNFETFASYTSQQVKATDTGKPSLGFSPALAPDSNEGAFRYELPGLLMIIATFILNLL